MKTEKTVAEHGKMPKNGTKNQKLSEKFRRFITFS